MHVVLHTSMPCEVGAAALYSVVAEKRENCRVIEMKIADARSATATIDALQHALGDHAATSIIMIGTYWENCLEQLSQRFPRTDFHIHCLGTIPESLLEIQRTMNGQAVASLRNGTDASKTSHGFLDIVSGEYLTPTVRRETKVGPAQFVINIIKYERIQVSKTLTLLNLFVRTFDRVIKFIDERAYGENTLESQALLTGLYNYGDLEMSLFDKFVKLFQCEYPVEDIISMGKTVISAHIQLSQERAVKNSRQVPLPGGKTAVVTEAPDLVNLTHDALHRKFPEASMTVTLSVKFGQDNKGRGDELAFSFRGFDSSIDVSAYARGLGGDGTSSVAGGRMKFEVPMPFSTSGDSADSTSTMTDKSEES